MCVLARLASILWPDGHHFLCASPLARRGPVLRAESQREPREFLMVAPGQDHPGRHPNEDLLLEALDEFDAVHPVRNQAAGNTGIKIICELSLGLAIAVRDDR